jgi:hypothetical protein
MKFLSGFRNGAGLKDTEYSQKLLKALLRRIPRKLPFVIYFDCQGSTREKLCFRVEHRLGTSNRVYVMVEPPKKRKWSPAPQILIDATDGSNWHHLRFEFVQWFRKSLTEFEVPANIELVIA